MAHILSNNINHTLDSHHSVAPQGLTGFQVLGQAAFLRRLFQERKRTERSHRRFILMLLKCNNLLTGANSESTLRNIVTALSVSTRETDIAGWYSHASIFGVIFTEIGDADGKCIAHALLTKVVAALSKHLRIEQIKEISLSFHVFPEDWEEQQNGDPDHVTLYRDLAKGFESRTSAFLVKRFIDIAGSLVGLLFLSPVLLAIATMIKATSRGPILFRQVRIGQHGRRFTFLKFRSMYTNSDSAIHEDYVKRFIAGSSETHPTGDGQNKIYKLTADPRITSLGRFLRKTSLDELPQLLNVLKGDMSLVGPRPPVPYEFAHYDLWHRQRLVAVKPGITGLWQVDGRSRVTFDEMVRLDIRYARSWSLWLDIKILLQTPRAVISGSGAC